MGFPQSGESPFSEEALKDAFPDKGAFSKEAYEKLHFQEKLHSYEKGAFQDPPFSDTIFPSTVWSGMYPI